MKRHPSRWAPAVAAVLILAACGADDGASSPVGAPTDASDSSAGPGDDDLRAPTPIEVVSGSSGGGVATADAESAVAGDVPASELRMTHWVAEYVIGDGMPALPTNDVGYVFDTSTPVTEAQVESIADALGVAGDVVKTDEGFGVSWRVGPDDGSGPSVWVYEDAQQSWNYNAAWGDAVYDEPCAVSIDADGNETSDCPEPTPPVGVPSGDEAEQRVREMLAALGVDPADLRFETYADEWFVSIDVSDRTDDHPATRSWHFGFGAEGVLQYASGTLAPMQAVGPYPLVDIDTAIARLDEGFFGGFGRDLAIAEPDIAVAVEAAPEPEPTDEVAPTETVAEDTGGIEEPPADEAPPATPAVDEPMPTEPMPPLEPLEPVVVTLVDVQPDLWWAWDADGTVWLLPAYRFIDSDGGWHTAPAVTDGFLIWAEPSELVDPIPVEGDGGTGEGVEPVAPPESLPTDTVPAETVPGETGVPIDGDPVDVEPFEALVGLSVEEFTAEAKGLGFETRVVMQDGEPLAVTMDFRTDRVNVAVDGDVVVAVESIG
jgi:hypothetical protein